MQLNKLKSKIKNATEVTLNLSPDAIGDCNAEDNFMYNFYLTDTQVSCFRNVYPINSSANVKLSKTKLSRIVHHDHLFLLLIK